MVVILMGVSGSGKTTIGLRLAQDLGWRFIEAEDFRSPESARKAPGDVPVSEPDLELWMTGLRARVAGVLARGENAVLAYSALKGRYRRALNVDPELVRFVYLKGTATLIRRRLRARSGHFLRESLLADQFAALEEPENAITIDIDERPGRILEQIRQALAI